MKVVLSDSQQKQKIHWFALVNHYDNMPAEIFQKISNHIVKPLYLKTPLEPILDKSPLVISLKENDKLVESLPKNETIYFATSIDTSLEQTLKQLRNRMQVKFDGDRKGLFHYYLPSIASYFFCRASQADTSRWLGCISAIYFYRQIQSEPNEWVFIEGDFLPFSQSTWSLTPSQEEALNDKFVEQEISHWAGIENIESIHWRNQKSVSNFCAQYQIEDPKLLSRLRQLAHTYNLPLDLNYQVDDHQTPETMIKQLEQLMSREYNHVC